MITLLLGALSLLSFITLLFCLSGLLDHQNPSVDERLIGGLTVFLLASNTAQLLTGLTSVGAKAFIGSAAMIGIRRLSRTSNFTWNRRISLPLFGATCGASTVLLLLAQLSSRATLNYDADLYHFAIVEALSSERLIIGWANVHERFAVQSSVFHVAAFLDNGLWGADGYRLSGSLFTCISLVCFCSSFRRVQQATSGPGDLLCIFALPAIWAVSLLDQYHFNGPSLDPPNALMAIVAATKVADFMLRRDMRSFEVAALAVVVSYSVRPQGLVLMVVFVAGVLTLCPGRRREMLLSRARPSVALLMVIVGRSFLLSGFPFAPLPWSIPRISWALDEREMAEFAQTVRSWGRKFGGTDDLGLLNFRWFPDWWATNSAGLTIFVSLGFLGLLLWMLAPRDVWAFSRVHLASVVSVGVIPLLAWFLSAPAPRFGWGYLAVGGALWTLAIDLSDKNRQRFDQSGAEVVRALSLAVVGLLVLIPLTWGQRGVLFETSPQLPILPQDESPALAGIASENPIELKVPRYGDQCGWEFWCSPRDPGALNVTKFGPWWVTRRS